MGHELPWSMIFFNFKKFKLKDLKNSEKYDDVAMIYSSCMQKNYMEILYILASAKREIFRSGA
jgi:hypothetical protein